MQRPIPPPQSLVTHHATRLDILVESSQWFGKYDSIEVWRSRATHGGPYEMLTGPSWAPPSLPLGAPTQPPSSPQTGPSATLVGKTVIFLIDGKTSLTVTFTGSDPTTFGTAATQINTQTTNQIFAFVINNQLIVQTTQAGAYSTLQVTGGTAAPLLGLLVQEPGNTAFGTDANIPLIDGQETYRYTDLNGGRMFWYRTRFYNSSTQVTSDYSIPFRGRETGDVSYRNLVRATIDVVDMLGVGKMNQSILLFNRFTGTQVEGKTVIGDPLNRLTDARGHAEFFVVRGTEFTVAVAGTDLVRDVTAPTDPAVLSFDLLDPKYGSNDLFDVKVPHIPYAVRRSL